MFCFVLFFPSQEEFLFLFIFFLSVSVGTPFELALVIRRKNRIATGFVPSFVGWFV